MGTTTNYGFEKHHFGYPVSDDKLGSNLDLIDAAIKAREDETDASDALEDGKIIVGNGSDVATDVAMSGDVTVINTGETTIGADKVTNTKLANIARGSVKVGGASNAPTDLVAKATGNILVGDDTDIKSVAMSGDVTIIADGTTAIGVDKVANTMLENMTRGTVKVGGTDDAPTDLDAKTDAQMLIGDGIDISSVAITGDVTIDNAGVTAIGADKVTKTEIAADIAGDGLTQAVGGELDVNVDDSTIEVATDIVQVKNTGITISKVESALLKGVNTFAMSFETGEQTTTKLYFPMKVTINKIRSIVMKALADTNAGTITGANSTGNSTNGVVTIAASAILNEEDDASPTTNKVVEADSYYQLTTVKGAAGGKVLVSLEFTRTA